MMNTFNTTVVARDLFPNAAIPIRIRDPSNYVENRSDTYILLYIPIRARIQLFYTNNTITLLA